MSTRQLTKRRCKCGEDMIPSISEWVCQSCDAKLIPYVDGEKDRIRPVDRNVSQDEELCPDCNGTQTVDCPACDGEGFVTCDCDHEHECSECDGDGEVPCQTCY